MLLLLLLLLLPCAVTRSYLVAVGGRSLYVAFMGTKQARDISTDLAFAHEAIWTAAAEQQTAGASPEVRLCEEYGGGVVVCELLQVTALTPGPCSWCKQSWAPMAVLQQQTNGNLHATQA
jgi:hypothetical protein